MEESNKETEWWWIDFLENEISLELERDLQALLEHSDEDRKIFENFRLLKEWLAESDPVGNWPLEPRLERLCAKIMAVVKDEEGQFLATPETKSLRA